jgi:hypothetical protein
MTDHRGQTGLCESQRGPQSGKITTGDQSCPFFNPRHEMPAALSSDSKGKMAHEIIEEQEARVRAAESKADPMTLSELFLGLGQ